MSGTDHNASAVELPAGEGAVGAADAGVAAPRGGPEKVEFDQAQLGAWARDVEEALFKRLQFRPATALEDSPAFLWCLAYVVHNRSFEKLPAFRGDFLRDLIHNTPLSSTDIADGMVASMLFNTEDAPAWKPVFAKAQLLGCLPLLGFAGYYLYDAIARRGFPTLREMAEWLRATAGWIFTPYNAAHLIGMLALLVGMVALIDKMTRSTRSVQAMEMAVRNARMVLYNRLTFLDQVRSWRWGEAFSLLLKSSFFVVVVLAACAPIAYGAHALAASIYDSNAWPPVVWTIMAGFGSFFVLGAAVSLVVSRGQDGLRDSFQSLEDLIDRVRDDAVTRERIVEVAYSWPAEKKKEKAEA
jgi:hypothetical protein